MYATVAHVETYVPARAPFSTTTKPSASQVGELIKDATAEVEQALTEGGYALPVATTATQAYRLVQAACAKCAAAAVEAVAPNADDKKRKLAQEMCDEAKAMIAAGNLPGLDVDSAEGYPRSGFTATSYFTRDMTL